jgi:hypothetical protein
MSRYCGQPWWSVASFTIWPGSFSLVELRGLEPLTPCLQSDVFARCGAADLASQLSASSREIPLLTPGNGTAIVESTGDPASLAQRLRCLSCWAADRFLGLHHSVSP